MSYVVMRRSDYIGFSAMTKAIADGGGSNPNDAEDKPQLFDQNGARER
jgi:hypothetical protein